MTCARQPGWTGRSIVCDMSRAAVLAVAGLLAVALGPVTAQAYEIPKNLDQGWTGNLEFGARATFAATDSTAMSANSAFTFRGERTELELTAKLYRSRNESLVNRRDADGNDVLDAAGSPVKDLVETTTNDRRFLGVEPRWFFTRKHYLFALADVEINEPADIAMSTRQVAGVGYKLWKSRSDYVSAAVGVGHKRLEQVSGGEDGSAIGYVGLRLKRSLTDTVSVNLELDTDFGGESRQSEAVFALAWKVREPVAIKLKYEARANSNLVNPLNSFDDGVEAALGVSVEVDLFP